MYFPEESQKSSDLVDSLFNKYGGHLILNNSLFFNFEYSLATIALLNEIVKGENVLETPLTYQDWLQIFIALICCHTARHLGACASDGADTAAIADVIHGTKFVKVDRDSDLWKHMTNRAQVIVLDIDRLSDQVDIHRIVGLLQGANPFQSTKIQDRNFEILQSTMLLPILCDPRFRYRFIHLFEDLRHADILEQLKISDIDQLRTYFSDEFWDTTYITVLRGVRALEQTPNGKTALSYLYANLIRKGHGLQEQ